MMSPWNCPHVRDYTPDEPFLIPDRRHGWRVLRASHLYRLILIVLLLAAFGLDDHSKLFGRQAPILFLCTVLVYMGLVLLGIAITYGRRPILTVQAHAQVYIDLIALTLMIAASGGLRSGLNSLLITAVAASGILLPFRSALLAAACAFLLTAVSWVVAQWRVTYLLIPDVWSARFWQAFEKLISNATDDWAHLGVLGAVLFVAATLTYALSERARRSEALACRRALELLEAAELNQGIVQHLQNGVLVVNPTGHVLLLNDTARTVLGDTTRNVGMALNTLSAPLAAQWQLWHTQGGLDDPTFRPVEYRPELLARFTRLRDQQAATAATVILLEDAEQLSERLQQIKLAGLGRLTAGIAHEIRNPLAAIHHAAQLLQESPQANAQQQRLAQIISDNVKRANRIIADVLDLARRDRVQPEHLALHTWLTTFSQEFRTGTEAPAPVWHISVEPSDLTVYCDPHQLRQVLWNLCANACQYGTKAGEITQLTLRAELDQPYGRPWIEVRDAGHGVPAEHVPQLFEPFFTTRTKGTGLGLYLSRELCQANRAQLHYRTLPEGGGCFRMTFAPDRPMTTPTS